MPSNERIWTDIFYAVRPLVTTYCTVLYCTMLLQFTVLLCSALNCVVYTLTVMCNHVEHSVPVEASFPLS